MASEPIRPKVGLLALTLEFYETLAPTLRVEREAWVRREVLPALESLADVSFAGAVFRRQDVDARVAEIEAQGVDALLVMLLSYSPSQISLPALKQTRLPIIVWNTQELWEVDATYDGPTLTANHGVHGTQDLCNVLVRSGVAFDYVTSHIRDAGATSRLADFFAAAAAVRRLRRARLGLLGYPFPGMGDFALDTTHMAATLGCEWVVLPIDDYIHRAADASAQAVADLVAEYRSTYDVAPDVADADLEATARVELALRGMVVDRGLDAVTYQFLAFGDDERTPTLPFVAASRLLAEGIGFGGEGDLIAAAGSTFLNWLNPPASFSEIFTIDFGGNSVLMSHMGEANVAMARKGRKVPLVARPAPAWPSGAPTWSGLATGTGEETSVTFDSAGDAQALTATCGTSYKTATFDVIVPEFDYLKFTSSYDIKDTGNDERWLKGRTGQTADSDPACFKINSTVTVHVKFWHGTKTLTFPTEVKVRGDVSFWDEYITGEDYGRDTMTLGTSWPSPGGAGGQVDSEANTPTNINYDHHVGISWRYEVEAPNGTDDLMDEIASRYTWDMNCHEISSDFVRLCWCLGINASLHKWASNADKNGGTTGDMCYQETKEIDPVGSTWGSGQIKWSWHQWAESGGKQYDPSANATFTGTWGGYEDDVFANYKRCTATGPPATHTWDANAAGQTSGCEPRGLHTNPSASDWSGPDP